MTLNIHSAPRFGYYSTETLTRRALIPYAPVPNRAQECDLKAAEIRKGETLDLFARAGFLYSPGGKTPKTTIKAINGLLTRVMANVLKAKVPYEVSDLDFQIAKSPLKCPEFLAIALEHAAEEIQAQSLLVGVRSHAPEKALQPAGPSASIGSSAW